MEATISAEFVAMEMNRYVNHLDFLGVKVDPAYIIYALQMFPSIAADEVFVIREQQLKGGVLASGAMGTAQFNTVRMIGAMNYQTKHKIHPIQVRYDVNGEINVNFNPEFINGVGNTLGIYLTEESLVRIAEGNNNGPATIINPEVGVTLPLDLLGYEAGFIAVGGIRYVVPVLQYKRLLKSFIYQKKNIKTGDDTLDKLQDNVLKFVRMWSLYLNGGWYYPALAEEIFFLSKKTLEYMQRHMDLLPDIDFSELYDVEDIEMTFGFDTILGLIDKGLAVPTWYDVIKLLIDETTADLFVEENKGKIYNPILAPFEILKEHGYRPIENNLVQRSLDHTLVRDIQTSFTHNKMPLHITMLMQTGGLQPITKPNFSGNVQPGTEQAQLSETNQLSKHEPSQKPVNPERYDAFVNYLHILVERSIVIYVQIPIPLDQRTRLTLKMIQLMPMEEF